MSLQVSRLRRWFAVAAFAAVAVVAGAYFYAQYRVQKTIRQIPQKLGLDIQKSLNGFTLAPSIGGRTIFKLQAKKAVQFKLDGHAELHDVTITLYGRDSSRFDQISGSDFEYDMQSGDITAKDDVQIDLEANPVGLTAPDQAQPADLKNPIHLKTSGLVFNQKTGDAHTEQRVDFNIPQANGSAVGVSYSSKNNLLTLHSQIEVLFTGPDTALVKAAHGTIGKDPRQVVLEGAHFERGAQRGEAEKAVLDLNDDNTLDCVLASGNVRMRLSGQEPSEIHADQMELAFAGQQSTISSVTFSGNVQMQNQGSGAMQGSAGRLVLTYAGKNVLRKARAEENVKIVQHPKPATPSGQAQEMELTAAAVNFSIAGGNRLSHAETSGAAQILLRPVAPVAGQTLIHAGLFQAEFDAKGQLASVHGAPHASIVSRTPNQPDRLSTSDALDAVFGKDKGMQTVTQQGNFAYSDGDRKATADHARYTPSTQMIELSGAPRLLDRGMTTTADTIRMNRATGDGMAERNVKSTYSDLKAQPGGALLASSSPIHVTAHSMTAHRTAANALYTGEVRLWQEANVIAAPSMEFDRNQRSITAFGSAEGKVSTVLVQTNKRGQVTPVTMISSGLSYVDSQRKAHFSGGVTAKASDFMMTAAEMDVFLLPSNSSASGASPASQLNASEGKFDRIVAQGQVVVTQPTRKATGEQLTYTASDSKFVLSGGSPSIFDAERGKITGVSLTLFRGDDRVLVEGTDTSPSVTQTRVAR